MTHSSPNAALASMIAAWAGQSFRALLAVAVLCAGLAGPAAAVQPDEILEDPALEARAREISRELRCLVCRNESIDESNAPLARDLRILVRERLELGSSNEDVIAHVRERYGDYVLLKPPVSSQTAPLWLAPLFLLLAGGALMVHLLRRHNRQLAAEPESGAPAQHHREA